jgi:nicotinate-nucleotide adenylyltransferase
MSYPGDPICNPGVAGDVQASRDAWRRIRRLGILGGSFDPVHRGHLHVARCAQAARALERIVFIPAAQPPHKLDQRLAAGEHRMAMLDLALRGRSDWVADALELHRPGPSYTLDTLRGIRAHLGLAPAAQLFLIVGSDTLPGLAKWRGIEELLTLAEPLIVAREVDLTAIFAGLRAELAPALVEQLERGLVRETPVDVSSSGIRDRALQGALEPGDLPPGVWEYIVARGIYGARRGDGASSPC